MSAVMARASAASRPGRSDVAILAAVAAAWAVALGADLGGLGGSVHHREVADGLSGAKVALYLAAWLGMVVAMMLPTALPMIRLFNHTAANQECATRARVLFVAAYLLVWLAFGIAVLAADVAMHQAVDAWSWLSERPWLLPGGSLLAAGLFQFSDLKKKCLTECRHPGAYLLRHYRRGQGAAFHMGIGHGLFCLGCCWALMVLMFAMGVASLAWMAALTAMMVVEKNVRGGERAVRPIGVALVVLAVLVLVQPSWLPDGLQYDEGGAGHVHAAP